MKRFCISLAVIASFALTCLGIDDYAKVINSMTYSPELEEYARQGNPTAQNALGIVYKGGFGVEKDEAKAVYWFQKAVEKDFANAQVNLGEAYLSGRGVERDPAMAAALFEKAALQDNQAGMFNLATLYIKGVGVPRSFEKAFQYAEKAANAVAKTEIYTKDNAYQSPGMVVIAKAQGFLALCYRDGIGTAKDIDKSMEYLKKAARNGNLDAVMILGDAYENGKNLPRDLAEAEKCYRSAADKGMSLAQYLLGVKYSTGETIAKNLPEAIKYLTRAVDNRRGVPTVIKADALLKLADLLEAPGETQNAAKAKQYRSQAAKLPAPDREEINKILSFE